MLQPVGKSRLLQTPRQSKICEVKVGCLIQGIVQCRLRPNDKWAQQFIGLACAFHDCDDFRRVRSLYEIIQVVIGDEFLWICVTRHRTSDNYKMEDVLIQDLRWVKFLTDPWEPRVDLLTVVYTRFVSPGSHSARHLPIEECACPILPGNFHVAARVVIAECLIRVALTSNVSGDESYLFVSDTLSVHFLLRSHDKLP